MSIFAYAALALVSLILTRDVRAAPADQAWKDWEITK